jgi:hypothetical protein
VERRAPAKALAHRSRIEADAPARIELGQAHAARPSMQQIAAPLELSSVETAVPAARRLACWVGVAPFRRSE